MSLIEPRGLFVTGTDTGVGKTLVAAALVRLAKDRGLFAVGIKPVETGCEIRDGRLHPEDGWFLWHASDGSLPLEECCPFRFSLPAAPARAAEAEGLSLSLAAMERHIRTAFENADLTVVEGAGGLMVPIEGRLMMIDLIERLGYPTILVGRTRLGTINHTLLSLAVLRERRVPVAGIVLSGAASESGPEEAYTPEDLRRLVDDIPVVVLPYLDDAARSEPGRIAYTIGTDPNRDTWYRWIGIGQEPVA